MSRRRALITGITGQDGSYLAELLLAKGYEVYGVVRRASNLNTQRIDHIYQDPHSSDYRLRLVFGDVCDSTALARLLRETKPDEVYNLAAQSHVRVSFDIPEYTSDVTALGTLRILEAIRDADIETKFLQASSSEMFGQTSISPQSETTPFHPRSPYACAKAYAHWVTINYRESYGIHASCAILFNHESPRRGETFVSRKISRAVAKIKLGQMERLYLGNLDACRDWGYAGDYVDAMWRMLQRDQPDDYVIATGSSYSVRDFLEHAFAEVGLDWHDYVEIDPRYFRPAEVDHLIGDPTKANRELEWRAQMPFEELVRMMVRADMESVS